MDREHILKADLLMLTAAMIWGCAFVAQRVSMEHIGPFTFNGVRFLLGAAIVLAFWYARKARMQVEIRPLALPASIAPGLALGCLLFAGATLQQVGLIETTAGKAGFLTGLYVVLVPLIGLLWKQRPGIGSWAGAFLSACGVYFLSVTEELTIGRGDAFVIAGALFWALHVQAIDYLSKRQDPVLLASLQFIMCGALSLLLGIVFEEIAFAGLRDAGPSILYGGILSVGIGYTMQVVAQRDAPPTHAAIILSLEAVFAAGAGWWVLGEIMNGRAILGCALLLVGVILAHLRP